MCAVFTSRCNRIWIFTSNLIIHKHIIEPHRVIVYLVPGGEERLEILPLFILRHFREIKPATSRWGTLHILH